MLIFLQLSASLFIANFLLQPPRIARGQSATRRFLHYTAIQFACGCALVNLGLNARVTGIVLILAAGHALLGLVMMRPSAQGWLAFLAHQTAHLLMVGTAALWIAPTNRPVLQRFLADGLTSGHLYLILSAYVATVFGGGLFVQRVATSFLAKLAGDVRTLKPGLPEAGTYIGWIERCLVLTFVLAGFNDAIGFLIAMKALARFPEIKEDVKGHFAEYFLVGTLTSVGVALIAGLLVRRILPHV